LAHEDYSAVRPLALDWTSPLLAGPLSRPENDDVRGAIVTDREPLSLLATRAIANVASFKGGFRQPEPAIRESCKILCCLVYETERGDLWRATEQLCQAINSAATESTPPPNLGLDWLMEEVVRANRESVLAETDNA
jgi:hypothetical protein